MNKPYQCAPLSEHHLRVGLLVNFADEVNRGLVKKARNPMGSIYVFDEHSEILQPGKTPENWPSGLIRIYREAQHGCQLPEFSLNNFEPARTASGYDAKHGGSLDPQGLRFLISTQRCGLMAHYLVVPELEQLSFVPLQGHHRDDPKELVAEVPNLTGYDRRLILELYESSCLREPYSEEVLEARNQVPHTYDNWLFLNACIVSRIVTMRQAALASHGEAVYREATGQALPVDVSEEKTLESA